MQPMHGLRESSSPGYSRKDENQESNRIFRDGQTIDFVKVLRDQNISCPVLNHITSVTAGNFLNFNETVA